MEKIKISKVGDLFIEIRYNNYAANFEKSYHLFPKTDIDIIFNVEKTALTITFKGNYMIVTDTLLGYIDTTATTLQEFYEEVKTLL